MKKFACRYAVVQFVPYSETGEFANVGVVLVCPESGFFDFRLQTRKYARVTRFFDELSADVYRTSIQVIFGELARVQQLTKELARTDLVDQLRVLFENLVHPREAIIRFGQARAVLASSPEQELQDLFDHYVDRSFATPEYVEATMTKRLNSLLGDLQLVQPFRAEKIGDDEVHARFPFVQKRGDKFRKIIKPLNLSQAEPNGIFDHGDAWIQKMRRLRKRGLLPDDVLFTVAAPPLDDSKRRGAFDEIREELKKLDVLTVDASADAQIVAFASR